MMLPQPQNPELSYPAICYRWHWEEKDRKEWTKARLAELFSGLVLAESGEGEARTLLKVERLKDLTGDVSMIVVSPAAALPGPGGPEHGAPAAAPPQGGRGRDARPGMGHAAAAARLRTSIPCSSESAATATAAGAPVVGSFRHRNRCKWCYLGWRWAAPGTRATCAAAVWGPGGEVRRTVRLPYCIVGTGLRPQGPHTHAVV